jgi:type I restriction enzyme S subunit
MQDTIGAENYGVTRQALTKQQILDFQIPLAPLNEQKRIADKLDAVLARVDACRERLDRVPVILKRFRQTVLAAATSGKLTEEWREGQILDDWQTVSIEAVASEIFDGPFGSNLKSKDYSEAGVRVVRLENIGWLNFIADKETFIPQEKYEALRKHTLKAKDVLFSSFIAEEVRVCLLPDELSEQAINKADCFCVRTDLSVCLPEFLALRLACRSTFLALEQEVHGTTRPRINLRQLKEFTFELPPLSEQHEIVRCVEALFTYADRLEARYSAARARVERLTPALLAKAFCGELVPQDPSDEPASVLLERIRAARVEQPTAKRGRKPPATRVPRAPKEKAAMTKSRHDDDVQHKPYLAGLLREAGGIASVEDLFRRAELPVTDFYKQLAWEVENGHIRDDETRLEAA